MALSSYNLFSMRGAVKDQKANAATDSIDRALNRRIQQVTRRHDWSDLLRFGTIPIPDTYNTGTVTMTNGSNVVNGTGMTWPTNDEVSTTIPLAITQPGKQLVKPGAMKKLTTGTIQPGDWLLIDPTNGTLTEAVVVEWVSQDGLSFVANFQFVHKANTPVWKSSLAGRQFQSASAPFTVKAVLTATQLWLDQNWGAAAVSGQSYNILKIFFQVDPYARKLKFAWDYAQGIALDVDNYTFSDILIGDPQLSTSDNPTLVVPTPVGPGGVNQWMFYPPQTSARQIGCIWVNTWPKLIMNNDTPPPIIDPECFIAGARADVLRIKVIGERDRVDPYFDPNLAAEFERQFVDYVEGAEEQDEAQSHHRLQSYQYSVSGGLSADYYRSHPGVWPSQFSG